MTMNFFIVICHKYKCNYEMINHIFNKDLINTPIYIDILFYNSNNFLVSAYVPTDRKNLLLVMSNWLDRVGSIIPRGFHVIVF
jgi:hypothetical protein